MATYLEYMREALKQAQLEFDDESSQWFASIPGFGGLWAIGPTQDSARAELFEALDAWLDGYIKIAKLKPPVVNGLSLDDPPKLLEE